MPKQPSRDGVFQRKDTAGWYASYVDSSGKRRKKRVIAHTRAQAVDALNALKTRAQTERILGVKHVSDITTEDLLKRYTRYQKSRLRESTFLRLDSLLSNLRAGLPSLLKEISRVAVADYIAARSGVVSPSSIQKEIAALKHALRLAVEWELIHSNPAERAKLPKVSEGRTRYLTPTELRSALEAAPEWMKAPIGLAAFTGMRMGEILSLHWRDVDLAGRRLFLRETKNGSMRVIALNDLAHGVIASLPAGRPVDLLLSGVEGNRLSQYTKRLFKSQGIHDASFHSLRHTAASWLAMSGVDLYAVGQVLGHKTPRMTQRYAHLSPSYMASAVGKLDQAFAGVLMAGNDGTPTGLSGMQSLPKPS